MDTGSATLGPDAFGAAPGTPRIGSEDHEQEHSSRPGDTAEARAGILAAKSGEMLERGGIGVSIVQKYHDLLLN